MNKNKILIVDDEEKVVELLKTNLSFEGFEVLSAFRGDDAIDKAIRIRPDLILLDIMMPKPDGLEVCRILKNNSFTKDIPVIMVSCIYDGKIIQESFNLGAEDYLTKPFSIDSLLKSVKKSLLHKILIVDDCEELRFALRVWFEEKGYLVSVAEDGNEAINLLKNNSYDLVLLDYHLGPGPDGLEVFYYIKEKNISLKTLFMTSEIQDGDLKIACSRGALGLLQKPFTLKSVEAKIQEILEV